MKALNLGVLRRFVRVCVIVGGLCGLSLSAAVAETSENRPVLVVASIQPLALLVRELLQQVEQPVDGTLAQVETLLPATVSPHHYALRISDRQRLERADLVVWIGPELERFLTKTLSGYDDRQLALAELPQMHWPTLHVSPESEIGEYHHFLDPHLWLNPDNGIRIIEALVERLQLLQPSMAEVYQRAGERLIGRLQQLDITLAQLLRPVKDRGFAVYHQGYDHWVAHFGLNQMASVTLLPEQKPGARHLYQLRQQLQGQGYCLFVEVNGANRAAEALARDAGLAVKELDPLGVGESVHSYTGLLEQMAEGMLQCLSGESAISVNWNKGPDTRGLTE